MVTQCTSDAFPLAGLGRRHVVAKFDGGRLSSDGGAVLLRAANQAFQGTVRSSGEISGLNQLRGQDLPESVRKGQRLTTMTASQTSFPLVESAYGFKQHGASGTWVSELLPHTAKIADEISVVRTMHTDAINHDPAVTFLQTGAQIAGRPSVGSWLSYGLGSESSNLPSFVVMITQGTGGPATL